MKKLLTPKVCFPLVALLLLVVAGMYLGCKSSMFRGRDGSKWKVVSEPGFGNDNNSSVVAMAEYKDYLYAMTRNKDGAEVWRYDGTDWEQLLFPGGHTNGFYGNHLINNIWGRMIIFKDKLYFGTASGFQGDTLNSTACEIWRYDGTNWEAVISDRKDADDNGTITGIAGCADADANTTAQITDSTKSWAADQWKGAMLQITSGDGTHRKFAILGNTATTLTIQQDERAGTGADQASEIEYTVCAEQSLANAFPFYTYTIGAVRTGDAYEIGAGTDESGFGDFWNKTVTDMQIMNDRLYVSTGLNYARGSQVWYTDNGDSWQVTQPPNSFGNYHVDPADDTISAYPGGKKPVSSSLPCMAVSSCSGQPILYATGTGTTGSSNEGVNRGRCARVAKLTDTGWELIVDQNVDGNDTGTNENGLGDCQEQGGNFMVWNMVEFNDRLFAITNSMQGGTRILYTETGGAEDGSWHYSVGCPTGDDACESAYPSGFDGKMYPEEIGSYEPFQNISGYLHVFNNRLYCGTLQMYWGDYKDKNYPNGAHIWRSDDGITWKKITTNGFRDDQIIMFEAFAEYKGSLYVSGSKSANTELHGLGGAKVYCQIAEGR